MDPETQLRQYLWWGAESTGDPGGVGRVGLEGAAGQLGEGDAPARDAGRAGGRGHQSAPVSNIVVSQSLYRHHSKGLSSDVLVGEPDGEKNEPNHSGDHQ